MSKGERALIDGADAVDRAESEIKHQLGVLENQLQGLQSQWRGQGAMAFQGTMVRWNESARKITEALRVFEANLRDSDVAYNATDTAQQDSFARFDGRIG